MLYAQPFGAAAIAEIVCARVAQSGTPARPRAVRWRSSRAGGAEACGWTGARREERWNSVEIQPSWSVSTVVRTVLCNDALYMYEATDYRETAQLMSELSNHWLCRLQPEPMSLCRRSGDGRALRTHALTMQRSNPHLCWSTPSLHGHQREARAIRCTGIQPSASFGVLIGRGPTCVRRLRLDLPRALAARLKTLEINTVTATHCKHWPAANNSIFPGTVYVGANTVIPSDS